MFAAVRRASCATMLAAVIFSASPSHADDLRVSRRYSLSATASFMGAPMGGVQLSANLSPRFALDLSLSTMGRFTSVVAGGRFFILRRMLSPYLFARGGSGVLDPSLLDPHKSPGNYQAFFAASSGAGAEALWNNGLVTFFEAAAYMAFAERSPTVLPRVTAGVGYRF
ncbi:MAG: hypothetical protein H6707_00125 [Deltaproteobacteria bacterium]|nr:hypothetical protein [Deltaproteobacteria bacterium]